MSPGSTPAAASALPIASMLESLGPVEIEPVLVGEAVVAAEPFGFDAEMPLIDEGALEHREVLVDVGDLVAEMLAGEMSRHILRHQVGRNGGADRNDTGHAACSDFPLENDADPIRFPLASPSGKLGHAHRPASDRRSFGFPPRRHPARSAAMSAGGGREAGTVAGAEDRQRRRLRHPSVSRP